MNQASHRVASLLSLSLGEEAGRGAGDHGRSDVTETGIRQAA